MVASSGSPLNARELPALLERVHDALDSRRETIDELNVFPVPDGDTGTNMTSTVRAALDAMRQAGKVSGKDLSRVVIRGAVGGARGNSGVILSQVIRAVVEAVAGRRKVDADLFAAALTAARDLAYEAVAEPVEGTMLTAISAAARAAQQTAAGGADLIETSAAAFAATAEAVERTPEQLEVLRVAGVVDAGARGFEVVLAAVHGHLTGQDPDVVEDRPAPLSRQPDRGCHVSLEFPFEVQYLLDAKDAVAAPLRADLEQLGDSVVVVAAGGLLNVHVHTANVGAALEAGITFGRPSQIAVTHFGDQMAARATYRRARIKVVAVVSGDGAVEICETVGATVVESVDGGLPSVADLLNGIARAGASTVVLLPGHRNTIAAATQAASLALADTDCRVEVISAADSPPAVFAALAVFDEGADPSMALAEMHEAAAAVRSGEIVEAVRDADTPLGPVHLGQALAVAANGTVIGVADDPVDAAGFLCEALGVTQAELITLLVGAEVSTEEEDRVRAVIAKSANGATIDVVPTGHRLSRYWIGVE
ncbi:MAG: DAK2 domain-containing protein [Nitriliruptoraceae bacterium]